jgi:hypothetical protein
MKQVRQAMQDGSIGNVLTEIAQKRSVSSQKEACSYLADTRALDALPFAYPQSLCGFCLSLLPTAS